MQRTEWLTQMRSQVRAIYDQEAPDYWTIHGVYDNATHRAFVQKLLARLPARGHILDAACGAGRYDGMLLEADHRVLGIDQSGGMLAHAREHFPQERFPQLRYAERSLQEMDFEAQFDGAICIDALEHVCPEDWPGIFARLHNALRPGGSLYVTVELAQQTQVSDAYERARALGLPVVFGEVVDGLDPDDTDDEPWVYHYYPPSEQVRLWLAQAGLQIEEESVGDGYWHLLTSRP
jgi:2-polyprenyl-3-methyl-5-hydroxy-6-metoxy-1,4-benzoquinol methylase